MLLRFGIHLNWLESFKALSIYNTLRIEINIISSNQKYPTWNCIYFHVLFNIGNQQLIITSNTIAFIVNSQYTMLYAILSTIRNFAFDEFEFQIIKEPKWFCALYFMFYSVCKKIMKIVFRNCARIKYDSFKHKYFSRLYFQRRIRLSNCMVSNHWLHSFLKWSNWFWFLLPTPLYMQIFRGRSSAVTVYLIKSTYGFVSDCLKLFPIGYDGGRNMYNLNGSRIHSTL